MKVTFQRKTIISSVCVLALCAGALVWHSAPVNARQAETAAAKAVLSVTAVQPSVQHWPLRLDANGAIVAWQEAVISAETGGLRITSLAVDVGSHVKRGQVLAELARDSVQADVRRYQASLASAQASLAQARANADRARRVKGSGAVSDQQINEYLIAEQTAQASVDLADAQLAAQKITLAQTRIVAVDDGVVSSRSVSLGQVVSVGTELFRLQRQGRLEWQAELDSRQLAMVKPGAVAQVKLASGQTLAGKVRLLAPTVSTSTSRANVLVSLPAGATAGVFASGYIEAGAQDVLTVPEATVVMRDGHSYVFEIGADNKVVRHAVTVGQRRDGLVEVRSGVKSGMALVRSGGAFISDGDVVSLSKEPT